jgi:radical SAM protein with 4Fe4S-binding SPASM domain
MLPDAINFIRKLSLRKVWNILKVTLSYALSNVIKHPLIWGNPWFVSMEPASVCNLGCPQCPAGTGDISREKKFMDLIEYKKLLEEFSSTTAILSLYFQGEPLMHENFEEFVRLASDRHIYTQTSTNGQFLTEEVCRGLVNGGLDRIIVSLDGTNQETYQAYRRGGDFQRVKDGIRTLNRIRRETGKKNPLLIVQFLVFKHNRGQLSEVKGLARNWGADRVWIKSAQLEYPESADQWIPEDTHYSRYKRSTSGEWKRKGKLRNRCRRLWETIVITSDGRMVPCCFDKYAEFPMGRAGEQSVAELWRSKSYQEFRKEVLSNRKKTAICTNCTEGTGKIYF